MTKEREMLEAAMGIICNVSGGDLDKQSPMWTEAARRWIAEYGELEFLKTISEEVEPAATVKGEAE